MLHQPIDDDPGQRRALSEAVEDASEELCQWQAHRARLAKLRPGTDPYLAEREHGADLRSRIDIIARRVDLTAQQFIDFVGTIGAKMSGFVPGTGSTPVSIREKQAAVTAAIAEENAARKRWDEARHAFGRARVARRAAEADYQAYAAQPLIVAGVPSDDIGAAE